MIRTLPRRFSALILCLCLMAACFPAQAAALTITQQPKSTMVPEGTAVSVSVAATGDGVTYQWYYTDNGNSSTFKKSTNTTTTYSTTMIAARAGRKVYCVVRDAYGNTLTSDTATLSMGIPFAITKQPKGGKFLEGTIASATVTATGEALTYQWYYTKNGESSDFLKSSYTGRVYSATMNAATNGRKIYCVIKDKSGKTLTTDTVTLSIGKPLNILSHPSSVLVKEGETAAVAVNAEGEGLTYTWYYTENASDSSFALSSKSGPTYSVIMNAARDGRKVKCTVRDQFGYAETTEIAILAMGSPVTITTQPKDGSFQLGAIASASVVAEGKYLSYKWYYTENGESSEFKLSSCTSPVYSVTMTEECAGRRIYCVVSDAFGNSVTSETVALFKAETLRIVQQPENAQVKEGETASATVVARGDGLTYQWYYTDNGNSSTFHKSSITSNVYSAVMNQARNGRKIYCIVKDQYGNSRKTDTVTLRIGSTLEITAQPVDVTAEENAPVMVAVVAQGDGISYQWYYTENGNSSTFIKSANATNIYSTTLTAYRNGRQLYCLITDKYGNTLTTNTVTLSIKIPIAITVQPEDQVGDLGDVLSVSVEATGNKLTYQWYYTENGQSSEFLPSANDTATYSMILSEENDGRQVYCVVTDEFGNSLLSATATFSTRTALKIYSQPTSVTVANGATASVSVGAIGDGLSYQWYYTDNGNSSTFKKSSNQTATYTTVMNSSRDGRKVYCIVTDQYGNSQKTDTVTLSMGSPLAILFQPASVAVANGQIAKVTVIATGDELTYQWYYTNNGDSDTFLMSANTTHTYSTVMNAARDGRRVYCIVKDKHGTAIQTITVTLSMVP